MQQSGQTIITVLLGAMLSTILLMAVSKVFTMTSEVMENGNVEMLIGTLHMAGLHMAQSPVQVKKVLMTSALSDCFARKGINCQQFQTSWQPFQDAQGDMNALFSKTGGKCSSATSSNPNCSIKRTSQYTINCSTNTVCESVQIRVQTFFSNGSASSNSKFIPRDNTVLMPGSTLVSRAAVDFSCSSPTSALGSAVTAIDYPNLIAECVPFSGLNQSPSHQPLRTFATSPSTPNDWQTLESANCAQYGLGAVGLFQGQASCAIPQ